MSHPPLATRTPTNWGRDLWEVNARPPRWCAKCVALEEHETLPGICTISNGLG